jgi:hypothetical protein
MRHQGSDKDPSRVSVALSLSRSSPHRVEFIAPALRLGDCLLFLTVHPVPVLTLVIYHSALFIYSIKIVQVVAGGRTTDELCERRCARRLSNPTLLGWVEATAPTKTQYASYSSTL